MDHVLKQLLDDRAANMEELNRLMPNGRATGATAEQRKRIDDLMVKASDLSAKIDRHKSDLERERQLVELEEGDAGRIRASGGIGKRGHAVTREGRRIPILAPEERFAELPEVRAEQTRNSDGTSAELSVGRYIRGQITGDWRGAEAERALSTGSTAAGGILTLPPALYGQTIDLARSRAVIFAAGASTLPMPSQEVTIATVESDPPANWIGENVDITEGEGTFGGVLMRACKCASRFHISVELAQDAANAGAIIENQLRESLGLALDYAALRGIGAGAGSGPQPLGVRNWPGVQVFAHTGSSAPPSAPLGSPLMVDYARAFMKIRRRNGPDALSIIHSPCTAFGLDTATTDYGWLGFPDNAIGRAPKFVTTQIPENLGAGSNTTEAYVGDFRNVLVGIRQEVMIEVSRVAGDAFKKGQVAIRAYLRADVAVTQPTHHCVITGIPVEA